MMAVFPDRMVVACCLSFLVAVGPGCGRPGDLVPVHGQIVFGDGEPVRGGVVEFVPAVQPGRTARGGIGVDGRFRLETDGIPGIREGRYRVAIVQIVAPGSEPGHRRHRTVAERFGRLDRSGIIEEVRRGEDVPMRIVVESRDPRRTEPISGP